MHDRMDPKFVVLALLAAATFLLGACTGGNTPAPTNVSKTQLKTAAAELPEYEVTSFEVNQALGVQKDNHAFYVAGKTTAVMAFLKWPVTIDPSNTWLNVSRGGKQVFKLYPRKSEGQVLNVDFLCKNMSSCENWAAGSYTFEPYINGVTGNASIAYTFTVGKAIRILAVPVKVNYGADGIKSVSDDKWKTMGDFTQQVYPLADNNLKWDQHKTGLDASGYILNSESSALKLINSLEKLIPAKCKLNPEGAGCYDFVVGILPATPTIDGEKIAGITFPGTKAFVAVSSDADAPATIAHELAHLYGIGDTYDGKDSSTIRCSVNPAPLKFYGRNWDKLLLNIKVEDTCTNGPPASNLVFTKMEGLKEVSYQVNGAQVPDTDHPYSMSAGLILEEKADFMSAGGPSQDQLWITKDTWDWLFRRLVTQVPGLKKTAMLVTPSVTAQRFAVFSGTLSKTNTVRLDPWTSFTDTFTLGDSTGSLQVQAVNAAGIVVASAAFDVQFFTVHPPRQLTEAPFQGVISFPADTKKFQIVKDGVLLAELPVSDNVPLVGAVTPKTATTLNGSYTVTWTGSDTDGGNLTYTVEYNEDVTNPSSSWMVLADELETTSWTGDFSLLPGGDHARIRVTVDDGVLTATAESAEFIVPIKKPEILVTELPWGAVYKYGSDVLLATEVFDPQDGLLADDKLKWTSNISGELGYGSELIVSNLPAGNHTITLTATNSSKVSSSATVSVNVNSSSGGGGCAIGNGESRDLLLAIMCIFPLLYIAIPRRRSSNRHS
jgi:hypothetical protein